MSGGSSSSSAPTLSDSLFQRSLDDVIKSLRSSSDLSAALSRALSEIRREIRSSDPSTKSSALSKLTYLSSLHHLDPSWASFHALELLPSPSLPSKRSAYLAVSLSFHRPLLPLLPHQLHKDLTSPLSSSPLSPSLALRLLSSAADPSLASHLATDLLPLLSSPRRALRRQAIAASLHTLLLSPDTAALALPRLVQSLSDPQSLDAAVALFTELTAYSDPRPFLPLAPEFNRILLDSRNNWTLIKTLKIFARLVPLEPRLACHILEPVCDHLRRSPAKSLVFECIRTILSSLADHHATVRLAVDKVRDDFLAADDPNLRFLGLNALAMLGPQHVWAIEENREVVICSLTDPDPNIRHEALGLIMGMVFESNVIEISELLVKYALKSDPEFCNEILDAVLFTCGRNVYELIADFDWYVSLLGDMARNPHCNKGEEIEQQLVDIGMRVRDVRPELVRVARDLLIDPALLGNSLLYQILSAAAWISGEYVELSTNPVELVEALLQPRTSLLLVMVRAVYIQAVFKVLLFCFSSYIKQSEVGQFSSLGVPIGGMPADDETDETSGAESEDNIVKYHKPTSLLASVEKEYLTHESITYVLNLIETALTPLSECDQVEIQERAQNVLGLIHILREVQPQSTKENGPEKDEKISAIVKHKQAVFSKELGPVSSQAQKKVSLPEGLVLNENLADLATILGGDDDISSYASTTFSLRSRHQKENNPDAAPSVESGSLLAEHRKRHGLYYLLSEKGEAESNEYPQPNEPQLSVTPSDATEDLVNLTKQSLAPRKARHTKPRPVVIKLGEGDSPSTSPLMPVKESANNPLSDAICNVLLHSDDRTESSQKKSLKKSSRRRVQDVLLNSESISQTDENSNVANKERGSSSSRSRHHTHSKERHTNPHRDEQKEKKCQKNSARISHLHGKHKHRQRDDSADVVPQAPVIQDFLL